MVRELSHYVSGQRIVGTSGRYSDVFDPCTGEVQSRLPLASREEVQNVVAAATMLDLDRLQPGAEESRGRLLEESFEEPLDGG